MLIRVETARAQLDNRAFINPQPGELRPGNWVVETNRDGSLFQKFIFHNTLPDFPAKTTNVLGAKSGLGLAVHAFTFFKDNEYFNKIVEGYTLFGTQFMPRLVYYPVENLRLEAGVLLWKDFGNPRLQPVRPTFSATYVSGRHQFVLGNIRPHLHHGYIEPLLHFERVMLRPLEEGLQYRLLSKRVFLDAWVDWQRQQYRYSNFQEEIVGGLSGSLHLTPEASPVAVTVPVQGTALHNGGQIDTLDKPLQTLFNGAVGLVAEKSLGAHTLQALRFSAYALAFQDRSFVFQLPFKSGAAVYLNGTLETRYADVMLSYFQGQRFIAPLGGDLYQGISRTVSDPTYSEADRRLLLLRLLRDFRIDDSAALTVRVEPVYDLNTRLLDFSFGVYLNFRQEWLLGNVDERVRVGQ